MFVYDVESSEVMVELGLTYILTFPSMVSDLKSSMTSVLMYLTTTGLSEVFFGVPSEVSASREPQFFLASAPALPRLVLLAFWGLGGEESFAHLHCPAHLVLRVPLAHDTPKLMKYRPDWHIVLVTQLTLEFRRGETLPRRGEQVHRREPVISGS